MSGRLRVARIGAAMLLVAIQAVTFTGSAVAIGLREEREIGARFALEARRGLPLVREPRVTSYVRRLGARLVHHLDNDQFEYRFFVIQDPALNAFAVPGGYIYLNTGLVLGSHTRDELAGVLGHEIVHVNAHHVVRQQEKTQLLSYGTLLGFFLSAVHPALGAGAMTAGTAAQLKYQREFEQEADHVGLDLMRQAGFDPEGSPAFLRQLLRTYGAKPADMPAYFLTHPLTEDRVGQLEKRVAEMDRPAPDPTAALELAAVQAVLRTLIDGRAKVSSHYERLAAREPERVEPQYMLGLVHLYGEQPERARPLLEAAVATVPWARADHARALARSGDIAGARTEFEVHLRAYSNDAAARLDLARLLVDADEHADALPHLKRALALDPELDDAEYALAECLGTAGDAYGQWWHLGRAYELRGDVERAKNAYERARDLADEDSPEREQAVRALAALRSTFGDLW